MLALSSNIFNLSSHVSTLLNRNKKIMNKNKNNLILHQRFNITNTRSQLFIDERISMLGTPHDIKLAVLEQLTE